MHSDDSPPPPSASSGPPPLDPALEARIAAWVLGAASPEEAAELARVCAEQAEAEAFRRRFAETHGLLTEAVRPAPADLRLAPERRAKLLALLNQSASAATASELPPAAVFPAASARRWTAWALPAAASVALLGLLAAIVIPTTGTVSEVASIPAGHVVHQERGHSNEGKKKVLESSITPEARFTPAAPPSPIAAPAPATPAPSPAASSRLDVLAAETRRRSAFHKAEKEIPSPISGGFVGAVELQAPADLVFRDSSIGDAATWSANGLVNGKQIDADETAKPAPRPAPDASQRLETASSDNAVSTFSLHVSDASFRLARAALARGEFPDPAAVRPEEFYNAFDYGDPAPRAGEPVAARVEQAAHPFLQQRNLLRVALRVPATGRAAGQPLRLTLLLDTSGSMEREDRSATVRAALEQLATLLGPADRVTLLGFARTPRLLAERLPGDQAASLAKIAAETPPDGGTNLEAALALAADLALRQFDPAAQNRVVLLTDGAANLGDADPAALSTRVVALRKKGVAFDACGIGANGLDDGVLEALTRQGDGRYLLLDHAAEAGPAFARQLAGAFRPAAQNVKVQVRFNPSRVPRYRLIGFEQHRLREQDFRDDKIDAAELAAAEAAVALYQVEVDPQGSGELGEVFVRFRETATGQMIERSWPLPYDAAAPAFDLASPSLQLAGASALLAEKLRGGDLAAQIRLTDLDPVAAALRGAYAGQARVAEFLDMLAQARRLAPE